MKEKIKTVQSHYSPISYLMVDEPEAVLKLTGYRFLNVADIYHLRALMTVLLLPTDTSQFEPGISIFRAAFRRLITQPLLARVPATQKSFTEEQWASLILAPNLIILTTKSQPTWLPELLDYRDKIGLLTPSEELFLELKSNSQIEAGLLKGFVDLYESYRVIATLLKQRMEEEYVNSFERKYLSELPLSNLFENRYKISFLPDLPLPPPDLGRPAAYLLNRLSNNCEKPSLAPPNDIERNEKGRFHIPYILECSLLLTYLFAMMEEDILENTVVSKPELRDYYDYFLSNAPDTLKLEKWLKLGARLRNLRANKLPVLVSIPTCRIEGLIPKPPKSLTLETDDHRFRHIRKLALKDHLRGIGNRNFKDKEHQNEYNRAEESLFAEHRLISCQTAMLAMCTDTLPFQIPEQNEKLHEKSLKLYDAFISTNRKNKKVFDEFSKTLSKVIPTEILARLADNMSPVLFYSDLPFEWMSVNDYPICLGMPVSRIPLSGLNCWLRISQIRRKSLQIDATKPEKVLVIDLITKDDPIREFSNTFKMVADDSGLRYTYREASGPEQLNKALEELEPEIVVLDAHGNFDSLSDNLGIEFLGKRISITDFNIKGGVPPVWILSACDTATSGAIRGFLPSLLINRGAACVIATLHRVDAYIASMLVGRFLANIYLPPEGVHHVSLAHAFINAQQCTNLLDDQLRPLEVNVQKGSVQHKEFGRVRFDFIQATQNFATEDYRTFKSGSEMILIEILKKHGLFKKYDELKSKGNTFPESLLFTAFGIPSEIGISKRNK